MSASLISSTTELWTPGPTRLMGIVNVTPDSFADDWAATRHGDGCQRIVNVPPDSFAEDAHRTVTSAIDRGLALSAEGADLVDVGGESTRPGATRVSTAEELARVLPVIEALAGVGLAVSVDTTRAEVARAAIARGAALVNDVSGGLADPAMYATVADSPAAYVLQHWHVPWDHAPMAGGVADILGEMDQRAAAAVAAGVDPARLILDPGLGFGKSAAQNWALVAAADRVASLGFPVLWGPSRKRFLAQAYAGPTAPWKRDDAGAAVTVLVARAGAWGVRVHTIAPHRTAIAVAQAALGQAYM